MSDIAIKVENISKKYLIGENKSYPTLRDKLVELPNRIFKGPTKTKDFWALKDVSFEVKRGEVVGIIGRNGAGKSTLLKILARITEPTTGQITMHGRVASMLEVGTGFNPELTGRENIYLNGAIIGMKKSEIKAKFDDIVEFSGVGKFLDTPVKHYSSGMYVRLAFAVAAHLDADILLVDEVLAVGDAEFQKKCLGKMSDLSRSGKTIILVSHNMGVILSLCDKALLLREGKVESQGKTQSVLNHYASAIFKKSKINLTKIKHDNRPREFGLLTELAIYDTKRNLCTIFAMGDAIVFTISLKCIKKISSAEIGVKISSSIGIAVHYLTSSWEGMKLDLEPGTHIFEITVPKILLLPGKYIIGAWFLKESMASDDSIQEITIIEIISGNINGHLANFDKYVYSGSEVYTISNWRLLK